VPLPQALITATNAIMALVEALTTFWESAEFMPQGMRPPRPAASEARATGAAILSGASMLRERILKRGRVLPNAIIDVSAFMESYIDMVREREREGLPWRRVWVGGGAAALSIGGGCDGGGAPSDCAS
jgi:hypothetical protein